jgi:hypothetical protein
MNMPRIGDIVMTCRHIEVQDEAAALPLFDRLLKGDETDGLWDAYLAAQKRVWRVQSYILGLSVFRPVLRALSDWADFESEGEAQAYVAEMQAPLAPMCLDDELSAWSYELKVSFRECCSWLSLKVRWLRPSSLDDRLP